MNEYHEGKNFSLWMVIVTSAIVGTTVAAGTWQLARTQISDELEQYRRSSEWKLPETLEALGKLSKKVSLDVSQQNELIQLRQEFGESKGRLEKLTEQLAELRDENKRLSEEIESLKGPTVKIDKGLARSVGHKSIIVGVVDTNIYENKAKVQLGTELNYITIGTPLQVVVGSDIYIITLLKVDHSSCIFTFEKRSANG